SMNMVSGSVASGVLSVDGATVSGLTLPSHDGKVLVGIRPHDLVVTEEIGGAGLSARGEVEAVEPLGSETLVHVKLGDSLIIATAPGRVVPAVGSMVSIKAEAGSLYLFDAATEKALEIGRAHV